ncbi:MAG: type II modification methylase, partial [Candidatus Coatesbacteria bacterium]|nr:type II modification methylase [Candidatus Coatesbacteria bacterium]
IGIDINPVAIELSRLFANPPHAQDISDAFESIRAQCSRQINDSYSLSDSSVASHYLWDGNELLTVWRKGGQGNAREELDPSRYDLELIKQFEGYQPKGPRPMLFFANSRINASPHLRLQDIFTGRALRNIDLIIEAISEFDERVRRALLLSLTSASGQMSKMVFAVSRRGKNSGKESRRVEVGSWVIGFWRPSKHFEINVWNCFQSRIKRLIDSLNNGTSRYGYEPSLDPADVISGKIQIALANVDSRSLLRTLPSESVALVITDPPHGDRIPYLELSEIWNAILGYKASFKDEIVISNASERDKNVRNYNKDMRAVLDEILRILKPDGIMALVFNARDAASWSFLNDRLTGGAVMEFIGCFRMPYSARSVVQDNRTGALREDFVLIFAKGPGPRRALERLLETTVPEWSTKMPRSGTE